MSRLIDADALGKSRPIGKIMMFGGEYVYTQTEIDSAPTVDAVPVVRCRECKYHNKQQLGFCEMHLVRMNGNDFCSYGERKGGDE